MYPIEICRSDIHYLVHEYLLSDFLGRHAAK